MFKVINLCIHKISQLNHLKVYKEYIKTKLSTIVVLLLALPNDFPSPDSRKTWFGAKTF